MDKTQFNKSFDIAFQNALQRSFAEIQLPEPHVILESWLVLQEPLAFDRIAKQNIEK